jgi:hypothetical protein
MRPIFLYRSLTTVGGGRIVIALGTVLVLMIMIAYPIIVEEDQ